MAREDERRGLDPSSVEVPWSMQEQGRSRVKQRVDAGRGGDGEDDPRDGDVMRARGVVDERQVARRGGKEGVEAGGERGVGGAVHGRGAMD